MRYRGSMTKPSRKALQAAFGADVGAELRRIFELEPEELDTLPAVDSLIRQCHREPWYGHKLETALNAALGTHGAESIGECHITDGPPIVYLNTGDSYGTTLIYLRDSQRWIIGSLGDLAESRRYAKHFRD